MRAALVLGVLLMTACTSPAIKVPDMTLLSTGDCDQDNSLTFEELSRTYEFTFDGGAHKPMTRTQFDKADASGNGKLSLSEFTTLFKNEHVTGYSALMACK